MKLLRLKHWQLFLITFAIPFLVYIVCLATFIFGMVRADLARRPGELSVPHFSDFLPLIVGVSVMFTGTVVIYIWMYQASTRLQHYMHPDMRKLKVNRFRVFFFSPWIYLAILAVLIPLSVQQAQTGEPFPPVLMVTIGFAVPGHLYSMFCMLYVLYFTAKTVKSAEIRREAGFGEFVGEFFLLWFFPVGVWFIQPKINKVVGTSEVGSTELRGR